MSNGKTKDDRYAFESGARSSGRLPGFHRIPWSLFAKRLADRYAIGAEKYGDDNWTNGIRAGDRAFIIDRANHMLDHAHRAVEEIKTGVRSTDDNLAAVLWGAICLIAWQDRPSETPQESSDAWASERCIACSAERRYHSYEHAFVPPGGLAGYACRQCREIFPTSQSLTRHLIITHQDIPDPLDKEGGRP